MTECDSLMEWRWEGPYFMRRNQDRAEATSTRGRRDTILNEGRIIKSGGRAWDWVNQLVQKLFSFLIVSSEKAESNEKGRECTWWLHVGGRTCISQQYKGLLFCFFFSFPWLYNWNVFVCHRPENSPRDTQKTTFGFFDREWWSVVG
jgi:hypothetical protein